MNRSSLSISLDPLAKVETTLVGVHPVVGRPHVVWALRADGVEIAEIVVYGTEAQIEDIVALAPAVQIRHLDEPKQPKPLWDPYDQWPIGAVS